MKTSETLGALAAALAVAQGAIEQPARNREVEVKMKSGGSYKFKYATFDAILAATQKPLSSNGLAVLQMIGQGEHGLILTTRIVHKSGEFIEDTIPVLVGQDKSPQAIGSAISYTKRYCYCAALGITAEEDDDGNAAEGNQVEVRGKGAAKTESQEWPFVDEVGEATTYWSPREWVDAFCKAIDMVPAERRAQFREDNDVAGVLARLHAMKLPALVERVNVAGEPGTTANDYFEQAKSAIEKAGSLEELTGVWNETKKHSAALGKAQADELTKLKNKRRDELNVAT